MGGFAFKLYGKGEHSGKTVQPYGDAFGGKIDIRVQGLQVPQAFVITAAAGGAEQVHVFFGQVVAFNKSLDDARCGGVHHFKAIPHNSKCRYGERGAADAKPKAQIILDVLSSILATQMPCRSRRSGA